MPPLTARPTRSYEPATGLEVMQHYTQTKSVWVDLQEDPADWFGDA